MKRPLVLMDPTAACVFVQEKVGWLGSALPAASSATALNEIVPPGMVVPGLGVMTIFEKLPVWMTTEADPEMVPAVAVTSLL